MEKQNEKGTRKNKKKGNFLIALGLILLLAAGGLVIYNMWDARRAEEASNQIASNLIDEIGEAVEDGVTALPYAAANTPMPTAMIDGYEYIGILEIPSLGLTLPVMKEWDYDRLKISPCRFTGSYYTDDLVICAHNYAKHFSPIKWIEIGADVYFTNVEGLTIHYIVTNRETVEPTDVATMIENSKNSETSKMEWDMTLFTCNTGGQTRCAVRCSRAQEESGQKTAE